MNYLVVREVALRLPARQERAEWTTQLRNVVSVSVCAGLRGSVIVLGGLISWSILAVASGASAGVGAASSASIAVVVAATTGFFAIKAQRDRLTAQDGELNDAKA